MEIKLSIKQDDIEQAIKDYVASKGITTPVREINFAVARKGGFNLSAEVEVSEAPIESVAETVKAEPTGPVADTGKKPVAKAAKKTEEPAPAKKEEEAEDTPPFTPDADEPSANDDEQEAEKPATDSKSLFG